MRKLGRMIRRVLTAVSLLLFVAVLAAWVAPRYLHFEYYLDGVPVFTDDDLIQIGRVGSHDALVWRLHYWKLAVLFSALPSWRCFVWWQTVRRRRRALRAMRAGRCVVCGYDLRATPGRCPECGMVPPA